MRKLSKATVKEILSLHKKGKSERAIANAIGCSRSAVWYQIQKAKIA